MHGLGKRETLARLAAVEECRPARRHPSSPTRTPTCATAPQMLGLWKAPLYVNRAHPGTARRGSSRKTLARGSTRRNNQAWQPSQSATFDVHAFGHSARRADPIGFTFRSNGAKMLSSTTSATCRRLQSHLRGRDCLVIEIESRYRHAQGRPVSVGIVKAKRVLQPHRPASSNHAVSRRIFAIPRFDAIARYSSRPTFLRKTTILISSVSRRSLKRPPASRPTGETHRRLPATSPQSLFSLSSEAIGSWRAGSEVY